MNERKFGEFRLKCLAWRFLDILSDTVFFRLDLTKTFSIKFYDGGYDNMGSPLGTKKMIHIMQDRELRLFFQEPFTEQGKQCFEYLKESLR